MSPSRLAHPILLLRRVAALPAWVRRVDARAGRRINARGVHPGVDRSMVRLSRSADRGVLWFGAAAVLLLLTKYRPAVRGVASLTVASAVTNLVGKELFGGSRPLLKDIPVGRRLVSRPESGSFPSGHSASAAAFAAGVALESPAIGAVVAPVAGAVAYSRLHTGAHWLSDVLGGVAIGAGVAVLGKLLFPVPRRPPKREGGTPVDSAASPTGDGVFLVRNPSSGAAVLGRADPVPTLERRLPDARIHVLTDDEDVTAVVRAAIDSGQRPRILGVCGGDGMVATLAQLARTAGLPLLVVPGGTFNHFARTAGIDTVDDALDALAAGDGLRVDVAELKLGTVAPETVINAASVGLYPDFVAAREELQPVLGKWIAGVVAAVRVIGRSDPVELVVDDRRIMAWSLFVGINRNHPHVPAPMQRRRLDDGVLDVRILHARSRIQAISALSFGRRSSAVLARLGLLPVSSVESFTTRNLQTAVRPREGQPTGFAHDGEVRLEIDGAETPQGGYLSRVRILDGGLTIYAPRR
ncbi:undecaprenyl-diphosphatase [Mycetocola sp. CAN_C7]|uniref:phosphatase PAP2 family protein n=1 Tax=Mycetocola sp. CAN_C7 TaxID=2787724 RepID=UPI0018CA914D